MKTLAEVAAELQVALADLQAIIDSQPAPVPAPVETVKILEVKTDGTETTFVPEVV